MYSVFANEIALINELEEDIQCMLHIVYEWFSNVRRKTEISRLWNRLDIKNLDGLTKIISLFGIKASVKHNWSVYITVNLQDVGLHNIYSKITVILI